MKIRLGVVMDPIGSIHAKKDSTLAMLLEAQKRGWELHYFEQRDLFLLDGVPYGDAHKLTVSYEADNWFTFQGVSRIPLASLDDSHA